MPQEPVLRSCQLACRPAAAHPRRPAAPHPLAGSAACQPAAAAALAPAALPPPPGALRFLPPQAAAHPSPPRLRRPPPRPQPLPPAATRRCRGTVAEISVDWAGQIPCGKSGSHSTAGKRAAAAAAARACKAPSDCPPEQIVQRHLLLLLSLLGRRLLLLCCLCCLRLGARLRRPAAKQAAPHAGGYSPELQRVAALQLSQPGACGCLFCRRLGCRVAGRIKGHAACRSEWVRRRQRGGMTGVFTQPRETRAHTCCSAFAAAVKKIQLAGRMGA